MFYTVTLTKKLLPKHFSGSALIKWLSVNNKSTEEEAMKLGEKLRMRGYFYRLKDNDKPLAKDSSLYRFQVPFQSILSLSLSLSLSLHHKH
jgi:hypothetical protein